MSDFLTRFYDDLRKQYESMTSPGYFRSTPETQTVTDISRGRLGGTLDPAYEGSGYTPAAPAEGSLLYAKPASYVDPLAGLDVETLKAIGGDEYGGGITTDREEQSLKVFESTAEKPPRYKEDLKTIQDILAETAGGEPPDPIKVEGRMPGLLDISQSSPRYRPTTEPYTYGQFESQLMTPSQQMSRTQQYLEQLFKSTIAAAPRLNFRGLL